MFDTGFSRQGGSNPLPAGLGAVAPALSGTTLPGMLARIDRAVKWNTARLDATLADTLATAVHDPDLLEGIDLTPSRERYTRHLIHQGEGYSVLAVVWMPGQMSPIHSHRTWCVLGVHRGWLTETLFNHGRDHAEPIGGRQLFTGDVSHSQLNMTTAHRMANLGCEPAVSIHIYGAAFERLGKDVNHVWSD